MKILLTVFSLLFCGSVFADLEGLLDPLPLMAFQTEIQGELRNKSIPKTVDPALLESDDSSPVDAVFEAKQKGELVSQPRIPLYFSDIKDSLTHQIETHYSLDGDFEINTVKTWKGVFVSDEAWELDIIRFPKKGLSSRFVAHFRIVVGRQVEAEVSLVLNCELLQPAYVSRQQLRNGDSLDSSQFDIKNVDVLLSRAKLFPIDKALQGYEVSSAVRAGKALEWRQVQLRPVVRKGQVVEALASEGVMRISMKALAMQSGATGDFITVRNMQSRKEIQAQIINGKTVKVYF